MRAEKLKSDKHRLFLEQAGLSSYANKAYEVGLSDFKEELAQVQESQSDKSPGVLYSIALVRALKRRLRKEGKLKPTGALLRPSEDDSSSWAYSFRKVWKDKEKVATWGWRIFIAGLLGLALSLPAKSQPAPSGLKLQIKDEGSVLITYAVFAPLNFTGGGINCNVVSGQVDCNVTSGAGATHQIDSVALTAQDPINFLDTSEFDWTNPAAGNLLLTLKAGFFDALVDFSAGLCGTNEILEDQGASWACIATPSGGNVDLLDGSVHQDTVAGTVVRGDIITGQAATPLWTRLALGGTNLYLKSDGTDVVYSTLAAGGVGSCTNQFVSALNADAVPTCDTVVPADMDLTVTYTFNNAADSAYTAIEIQAGSSADQTALVAFKDFGGADEWTIGKTSGNAFRIHDTDVNVNRLFFTGGGNSTYRGGVAASDHLFQSDLGTTRARILGDADTLCLGTAEDTCLNRSAAGILDLTDVLDANTGFRIAGVATTGRFLRGDGTNFIVSSGAASGVGTCANQFARGLNDDAAPTCETVALITDTSGNFVDDVLGGNGVVVTHTPGEGSDPSVAVDLLTADDQLGSSSNQSGMEFGGAGSDKLGLLRGCSLNQLLKFNTTGGLWECAVDNDSGGSPTLDSIIAAAGAATINNADNSIVWNWQLTTSDKVAFQFGENVAGTATGNPVLLDITTLAGSTVHPFEVTSRGNVNGLRVGSVDGVMIALGTGGIDWPALLSYPTGCTNEFVRTIADTLTCSPVGTSDLVAGAADNTIIRDSAGFSVIGKSTTGTGDPADIVAGDETVLGRTGAGNLVFAQVATGQIANSAVTSLKLATANKTFDKSIAIIDPTVTEDDKVQWMHGKAVTYTDVDCSTDQGTATIDMDHRVITTPNTVGTDILTGTIICDSDNQADGGFADATIPANVPVNLSITAVSGTPGTVRIHIRGTIDP